MALPTQYTKSRQRGQYAQAAIATLGIDPTRLTKKQSAGNQNPAPKPTTGSTLLDNEKFNYLLSQFDNDMQLAKPNEFVPQMRAHLANLWNQMNDPDNKNPMKDFYAPYLKIAWQATNKMLQGGYQSLTPEERVALAMFTDNPNAAAIRTARINEYRRQQELAKQPNPLPKKEPWYSSNKFMESAVLALLLRLMGAKF
jgi:hypothetical protein